MNRVATRLLRLRRLTLAGACLAAACASDPAPPDPLFASAGPEGGAAHWRYVPLSPQKGLRPSASDFDRIHEGCRSAGPAATGVEACLAERGFYRAQCSDGVDNDDDGLVDHPTDPGCAAPHALLEAPACDDGVDNDGDGLVDWDGGGFAHPDPPCVDDPSSDDEIGADERRHRFLPF